MERRGKRNLVTKTNGRRRFQRVRKVRKLLEEQRNKIKVSRKILKGNKLSGLKTEILHLSLILFTVIAVWSLNH